MTRGERVCKFIQEYCVVPEGDKVGQPVVLADFQKLFILDVYDNPAVTDTAFYPRLGKMLKRQRLLLFA